MGTAPAFNVSKLLQINRFSEAKYFLFGEAAILPPSYAIASICFEYG